MEVGDVVTLKSNNNQKMTVNKIKSCDLVECVWFEADKLNKDTFSTGSLLVENRNNKSNNFLFG